ncbi:hypothetical protein QEV13_06170 [Trueperella pyogenes]|nr:hypothetical protein [Trueperella pyogenes]WHU60241.1 hypothetical protein QEV13_06170 [Trueperella pyogenes]
MEDGPKLQSGIIVSQGVVEKMFQDIVLYNKPIEEAAQAAEDSLNKMFTAAGALK